jgi:ribosomal-protein-alanine N-acetyltransferase
MDDVVPLHKNWANDIESVRYMRMKPFTDIGETQEFVTSIIEKYDKLDTYRWVITLKLIGEPIGFIGLTTLSEHDMTADFGYSLGRAFWGSGYATEALSAVLHFGIQHVGYNRIEAYHSINNAASGKVMIKAGMKFEGRARQKYMSNMGFEDCDMYAMLKDDI